MTVVRVTVEVDATDVRAARALVRDTGLRVVSATVPKRRQPKPWQPKAWEPGLIVTVDGTRYQIWSQDPRHRPTTPVVWAVPEDKSYAPIFLIERVGTGLQAYLRATGYNTAGAVITQSDLTKAA